MSKTKGYSPYGRANINLGFKIDELEISDELPNWADNGDPNTDDIIKMLKNNIKSQEAGIALMKLYVEKLEDKLNRLTMKSNESNQKNRK